MHILEWEQKINKATPVVWIFFVLVPIYMWQDYRIVLHKGTLATQAEVSTTFIVVHQGVFTYQVSSKAQINPFQTQVSNNFFFRLLKIWNVMYNLMEQTSTTFSILKSPTKHQQSSASVLWWGWCVFFLKIYLVIPQHAVNLFTIFSIGQSLNCHCLNRAYYWMQLLTFSF